MLILIAGITGNIGQYAARHALDLGHQVRGLGRTPTKLDAAIKSRLDSFITSKTYADVDALDAACSGVDAVICAYAGLPELHLEGQLLLLHAAERANVTRFLAASHNNDWRRIAMGDCPIYDSARMFHIQAALTSSIKPLHIFSGTFLDVFFGGTGQGDFRPKDGGVWDPDTKELHVWGSGTEPWHFTTEQDGGRWAVELVTSPQAAAGGFVSLCSVSMGLLDLKAVYEKTTGRHVTTVMRGPVSELEELVSRKKTDGQPWMQWFRDVFVALCVRGTWAIETDLPEGFAPSPPTNLETWLKDNPTA